MEKFTADFQLPSRLKISQPDNGYRFSLDPLILARQVTPIGNEKILDIGCGCGIIPLLLASRHPDLTIFGVELQKELAHFAKRNVDANHLNTAVSIIETDINTVDPKKIKGQADIITANPPYKKRGSGRLNPDRQKAIARHEITLDIDQVFACAARLLKPDGLFYLIFPAERFSDIILAGSTVNFCIHTVRFIHTTPHTDASRVVVCTGKKKKGPCRIKPPFYIYNAQKQFSDDYVSMFKLI